jgi:hypothetical protein
MLRQSLNGERLILGGHTALRSRRGAQGIGLVVTFLVLAGMRQRALGEGLRLLQMTGQELRWSLWITKGAAEFSSLRFPQNGLTCSGQRDFRTIYWWRGCARFFGEPPGKLSATAIAGGKWVLILACGLPHRTAQPHMKVIVMSPPGTQFLQP